MISAEKGLEEGPGPAGKEGPGKKKKAKPGRYVYGPFKVYEDSYVTGAGFINIVRRKTERVYAVIPIYENGRYPYTPKNTKSADYIMILPKPMILDLAKRIQKSKVRIRHRPEQAKKSWNVKFFPMPEAKKDAPK